MLEKELVLNRVQHIVGTGNGGGAVELRILNYSLMTYHCRSQLRERRKRMRAGPADNVTSQEDEVDNSPRVLNGTSSNMCR